MDLIKGILFNVFLFVVVYITVVYCYCSNGLEKYIFESLIMIIWMYKYQEEKKEGRIETMLFYTCILISMFGSVFIYDVIKI